MPGPPSCRPTNLAIQLTWALNWPFLVILLYYPGVRSQECQDQGFNGECAPREADELLVLELPWLFQNDSWTDSLDNCRRTVCFHGEMVRPQRGTTRQDGGSWSCWKNSPPRSQRHSAYHVTYPAFTCHGFRDKASYRPFFAPWLGDSINTIPPSIPTQLRVGNIVPLQPINLMAADTLN